MKVLNPEIVDGKIVVRETEEAPPEPGRGTCPFHGLVGNRHGLLMGGPSGNACGLTFAHAPCRMEMAGEDAAWDRCRFFNTPERKPEVDAVIDRCAVVTLSPDPGRDYTAADWFARVMGRPYRPAN
jgi:hypothetical protein